MNPSEYSETQTAPWVNVPEDEIMSIEHPCIVKNRSKAIEMLGGSQQLAHILEKGTQECLGLKFRPNDPTSKTILSLHNETNNVLLKVVVPKQTGRKRKRGSDDPFVSENVDMMAKQGVSHLLQCLRDNSDKCSVEAVGNIKSCHVWRSIPDFTYFTKTSKFLRNIESSILPQDYARLKQWSLPRTYGLEDTEIIPPPAFSIQSLFQNYTYRQNPAVKTFSDPATGAKVLQNRAAPTKLYTQAMMFDDPEYPTGPSSECPPLEEQSQQIQNLVSQIQSVFDKRPICTRRVMMNSLPDDINIQLVKVAVAYVCYCLRSGPYRDTYLKFGVDPRSDVKYRKYQTILLKDKNSTYRSGLVQRLWTRSLDNQSHIFDGTKSAPIDGKTWQLCDLHDPVLKQLVDVPDLYLRAECEVRYFGWYENGTIAKLRVLLKSKIDALVEGTQIDPANIDAFMQLPENWHPKQRPKGAVGPTAGYLPEKSSKRELEWAAAYRSICRTTAGSLPNYGSNGKGRLSKPKPKTRASFIDVGEDVDPEASFADEIDEAQEDEQAAAEYEEPDDAEDELD